MRTLPQVSINQRLPIASLPSFYTDFKSNYERLIKMDVDFDNIELPDDDDIQGTVGVISFDGFIVSSCDPMMEYFLGCVSLARVQEDLLALADNPDVSSIIINFSSGGGFIQNVPETVELIQQIKEKKPVYAYCGGNLMCSAAYYIACACTNVLASPSSFVGSIGTYNEYLTYVGTYSTLTGSNDTFATTARFENDGMPFEVTTIQGGRQKTVGSETMPLTDEQKKQLMADIQACNDQFRLTVKQYRGEVSNDFLQGDYYSGQEAMDKNTNLIDGTINSLSDFIQLLQSQTAKN